MRIVFYGKLASALGRELDVPVEGSWSVADLRRFLVAAHPDGADAIRDTRVRALVGDAVVSDDHRLGADDEVEFLAPVSGG